ncbi:N-acetylmuramoyl-L-alanine amidase family protein [Candidatus Azobacteroides pseudotrichonymphae]|uniref:N-acetylmuramoyl-L-alanine amidase n=1 Tax=Azobacteroides pseudotrichonymphae genomovar. CFP2 TaxID=511995 RepID=B6YRY4_AZOPC|nr:N-acetylmuramoyl-L-alanine amidase [Candidatus Azobacteroides pseudotrichonymphae]BAG83956.1 putative N-acetylmuramoyl-L-alanine amidase [Candidatus Azobacteroides pseudotrichonymphae genomovar. CFP2]
MNKIKIMLVMFSILFGVRGIAEQVNVVINPCHGGKDPGALHNQLKEKDVNLQVALLLQQELKKENITSALTRSEDTYVSLDDRVDFSNSLKPDLFISIQCNAVVSKATTTRGIEITMHPKEKGSPFCQTINTMMEKIGKQVADMGIPNRGVNFKDLYVIRNINSPAIMVGIEYITNPVAATLLETKQLEFAKILSEAIVNFIGKKH